jgi:hypothetical protein
VTVWAEAETVDTRPINRAASWARIVEFSWGGGYCMRGLSTKRRAALALREKDEEED